MKKTLIAFTLFSMCIASVADASQSDCLLAGSVQVNDSIHRQQRKTKGYTITEEFPLFPGGQTAFNEYIYKHMEYPEISAKKHIEGTVNVHCMVTKTGKIIKVTLMNSLDKYCDAEAVRLVKGMPRWIPGKRNGKKVDMFRVIPIEFYKLVDVVDAFSIDLIKGKDTEKETVSASKSNSEIIYTAVEQMPRYVGGDAAMNEFIAKNLKFPEERKNDDIIGKVYVRFVISKDGDVKDAQIMRSLDVSFDKEALRVINSMPKWIPGKLNGVNVPVYYVIPIAFKPSSK
ncbi:energy transducer TonB [uncultured Bacteroides sp.]|uniref:energy transducer TonB n=1 Tax=uncultured Bacteroides sp. TaxID=162156 RepID=UPI002AA63056|nr:energy transducer TonB [uncultured Bacteroides sp.]